MPAAAGGGAAAGGNKERWDGETTNQFERLSNDVSGFGKMPGESETDSLDDRSDMDYYNNFKKDGLESMETNGFDFYNKIGSMMQDAMAVKRERDVFSPPFQK